MSINNKSEILIKNFLDLSRLEIKDFYNLVSKSDMNKEIDNSILWELLYLRQLISAKGSGRISSKDTNNTMRLDFVIINNNEIIGYFCIRKPQYRNSKNSKNNYDINLFIIDTYLDDIIINKLAETLEKIKNMVYTPSTIFNLSVKLDKEKLITILDKSKFQIDRIDNQTYKIPIKIYQI